MKDIKGQKQQLGLGLGLNEDVYPQSSHTVQGALAVSIAVSSSLFNCISFVVVASCISVGKNS